MQTEAYRSILKRVGIALVVTGLLDIGAMVYCIVNGISYFSSFNIFAVIGGIFLLLGNLKAASTIRWFAVSFLTALVLFPFAFLLIQPPSLTLVEFRLNKEGFVQGVAMTAIIFALLGWIAHELGREAVQRACDNAGIKMRSPRLAALLAIAVVGIPTGLLFAMPNWKNSRHAEALAAEELGKSYNYHVTSLRISTTGEDTRVDAIVTAWKENEVRQVPVHWDEKN